MSVNRASVALGNMDTPPRTNGGGHSIAFEHPPDRGGREAHRLQALEFVLDTLGTKPTLSPQLQNGLRVRERHLGRASPWERVVFCVDGCARQAPPRLVHTPVNVILVATPPRSQVCEPLPECGVGDAAVTACRDRNDGT